MVDISTIPLSTIESVEIVTDVCSSVYGSDAVGGIVNLVTCSDIQGFKAQARYGWAEDSGSSYGAFQLAYRERRSPAGVALALRTSEQRLLEPQITAEVDAIVLRRLVTLSGDVTETYLRNQLTRWDSEFKMFRKVIAQVRGLWIRESSTDGLRRTISVHGNLSCKSCLYASKATRMKACS